MVANDDMMANNGGCGANQREGGEKDCIRSAGINRLFSLIFETVGQDWNMGKVGGSCRRTRHTTTDVNGVYRTRHTIVLKTDIIPSSTL